MTTEEQIKKLIETANLFQKKELMVTVTEREKNAILSQILVLGHAIDYNSVPILKLNIQSVTYSGVMLHFNIVP